MVNISVCMASYNGGQFIQRQLITILKQLGPDDEVVISDDGSTDDTLQIISLFQDSRIKVYINKGYHGPMGNFENALRHSVGQFIFLADQDDIWLPGKVETMCSLLENYDLVLSDCEVVDYDGNILKPSFFATRGSGPGFWMNLYQNSYVGCCMAFRRTILEYSLPFPRKVHMHDWWIGLLVEVKGRAVFCKQPLIQYVRHGGNASPTGEAGYGLLNRLSNRFFLLVNVIRRLIM